MIDKIKKAAEQEKRWGVYHKVQEVAMEDVACYPFYCSIIGEAYNDELNIPENIWGVFKRPIYNVDK